MDQKNFIVAIVLSVLIIVGWQHAFPPAKPPVTPQQTGVDPDRRAAGAGRPAGRASGTHAGGAARRAGRRSRPRS